MATAPAESSRSHGKGLGLSQSHSSSALDYSGDTFESFSEEEESKAPGSWCSTEDLEGTAVSEALESSSSLAGQSPAEEESEAAVGRAAIGKWIDAMGRWIDLKNKEPGIRPDKSVIRAAAGHAHTSRRSTQKPSQTFRGSQGFVAKAEGNGEPELTKTAVGEELGEPPVGSHLQNSSHFGSELLWQ